MTQGRRNTDAEIYTSVSPNKVSVPDNLGYEYVIIILRLNLFS